MRIIPGISFCGNMGVLPLFEILLAIIVLHAISYGQECDPNGISCINCTDYQECSGGAPKGPIFSCKNGIQCSEQPLLQHCWTKLNCYALNECTEVGIFPDATTESNYFVCLPDSGSGFIKYDFTCPEGEFFDKTTQMCVASDITSVTTPVPTSAPTSSPPAACTAPGIFPYSTNCKMYFRCSTSLKIFYYICPGTSYFNENLLKCSLIITPACQQQILQNSTTSTTPVTTPTTTTTPMTTPTTTTTPMTTPTTTTTPVTTPTTTTTPVTTPTTTTTPVTTPTTTTTPVTTPTTTTTPVPTPPLTTTTTTATPAPSVPFSCSAAGTFENPVDCKSYYRCSSSGKSFFYVCPNGSYYNELTKRCGLTITPSCRRKL